MPSLTETLWRKGNRTVVVWASLRGDGNAPPFDSVEVMITVTGGFIVGGEGAQQIAGLSNIDVRNFSQRDHFGSGGGTVQVSLDHRVETVFLLLTNLMQFVVDGNKGLRACIAAPDEQAARAFSRGSAGGENFPRAEYAGGPIRAVQG